MPQSPIIQLQELENKKKAILDANNFIANNRISTNGALRVRLKDGTQLVWIENNGGGCYLETFAQVEWLLDRLALICGKDVFVKPEEGPF